MSLPYRTFEREVAYQCPLFEAAMLVRTTQRSLGLSRAKAQQGIPYIVSMYGCLLVTPTADHLLTCKAWAPHG